VGTAVSLHERSGERDLTYSGWHRTLPARCSMMDLDGLEFCAKCKAPLALIETAYNIGQFKPTTVTAKLAELAGLPAYLIMYTTDNEQLGMCKVYRVKPGSRTAAWNATPKMLGEWITGIHDNHSCTNNGQ